MFKSISEFIAYLESIPMFNQTYQEREESIKRARIWIKENDLTPRIPIVTVTGTNGKGSTVKAIAEILVSHGKNVCTFTSPHLHQYNERICYNLQHIDDNTLLRLANTLSTILDLSTWNFFFILFFINLLYCKEIILDCLILEVSIGGRLDVTNALDASLVILTQVALDHTEILGATREEIGWEKSGLLRKNIPFVCGEPNPPNTVIEAANDLSCAIYRFNKHFGFEVTDNQLSIWLENEKFYDLPPPKMHLISLCSALQAARLLYPAMCFDNEFIEKKLTSICLPGRYQQLTWKNLEFVVDVSHNPTATDALAKFLLFLPKKQTIAIFGVKMSKDINGIIKNMKKVIDDWQLVTITGKQATPAEDIAKKLSNFSLKSRIVLSIDHVLQEMSEMKLKNTRVVAFGSFQIVGPVLKKISEKV